MAPVTSWKRAEGIITTSPTVGGAAADVGYAYSAAYVFGGEGQIAETYRVPTRPIGPDVGIAVPAQVGHPCTVTIAPDGTVHLFTPTEQYEEENCE